MPHPIPVSALLLALASTGSLAGTIFVDDDAAPGGNGSSWSSAFNDLQLALGVAQDGDEVRVAAGTYRPSATDRGVSFSPRTGVTIRGGYRGVGSAGDPNERDPRAFISALCGDLNNDDDLGWTNRADNSCNVVYLRNVERVVFEGLTIRGGYANLDFRRDGGGINSAFSKFIVRDCVVTDNVSDWNGAGIALLNSFAGDIDIVDSFLIGNRSFRGGGAVATYSTSPRIINCYIAGNASPVGSGFYVNQNALIVNCTVVGNPTIASGGGVGGALYVNGGSPVVVNSIMRGNGTGTSEFSNVWVQGGAPTIRFSSIGGLNGFAGNGNVNLDPGFVDLDGPDDAFGTRDDQPRLPANSPLRDIGDASLLPADVTTDLFGGPRLVGDTVDMGADEFGCPGDANGDGVISFADLNLVLTNFGVEIDEGDLNGDGVVNFADLNLVLSNFGVGCGR